MLPPAPGRFSTTILWPTYSESFFTMMRAVMSVPPPGANPTTMVTGRFGNGACARAPAAQASATTAAEIPLMVLPPVLARLLKPRVLFSLEQRFPLLHESAPALDVILAPEALLHERRARLRVERRARFQQLADGALGSSDRERRVLRNHRAILEDERFQIRDRCHAVYEAHRLRLPGAELAPGDEHFARVGLADRIDQVLQRQGAEEPGRYGRPGLRARSAHHRAPVQRQGGEDDGPRTPRGTGRGSGIARPRVLRDDFGERASHDPSVQTHRPRAAEIERDVRRGGVRGAREGVLREPGLHRGPARFHGEEETAFPGKIV